MNDKNWSNPDDPADVKKGDRYTLVCGHSGLVVWISVDHGMICIKGVNRSCRVCGKKSSGSWVPTYHLVPIDDTTKRAV